MNVEYTGRKITISPAIRKEVETGLTKIRKILRDKFETKVILTVEKHRHKAEITINPRNGPIVALAQAGEMNVALNQALDHLEKQAVKYKTKWRTKTRHNHVNGKEKAPNGKGVAALAGEVDEAPAEDVTVHKFPAVAKSTQLHLVRSDDAIALRPLTLEEAIKEVHSRDRDIFLFRDPQGQLMVLHRNRQGKLELIEVP